MTAEERIVQLEAEKAALREQVSQLLVYLVEYAALREQVGQLQERVAELEGQLAKDSHNRGKLPSRDGLFRKPHSQRQPSGQKSGRQRGHAGYSLQKMKDNLGGTKLQLVFLVISLFLAFILVIGNLWLEIRQRAATSPRDYTRYVNMVQGPWTPNNSDRQVFMRYPLGRVGLWSRAVGEIADSVTRGVVLYPTVDQIINKDNTDWRNTIIGNPSETDITYRNDVSAEGSTVALTVTPNVSIYRYHFNNVSSYAAVAIKLQRITPQNPYYHSLLWTNNTITIVDNQTIQATLGNSDRTIYYYIKFSMPAIGRGTFIGSAITDGSSFNTGANNGGYLKFKPSTPDVTVAVALSHSSMALAQQFFTHEFSDFNFAAASQRLKDAWNAKLGKIDVQSASLIAKQMLYTGLYTVYANVINATDGSPYAPYAAAYGSPILTIGSSPDWAYIGGGYLRCQWDIARDVYPLLTLIDPHLMTDLLHTYQAQYDLNKVMLGNWDPYCTRCWNDIQWGFFGGMFLRAYLQGVTGVDYNKAKNAIADTFGNTNNYMYKSQYLTKGYIPADAADGGTYEYMSRGLEFSTQLQGLALLANVLGDNATYHQFIGRGQNYKNNWDAANKVFRGKNSDGPWAARNTGFFEGSDKRYAFDVVHDPLGLADLYGDSTMTSQINTLLAPNKDYNDYEPTYQILPIYSNSPSTAQDITRNRFVPQFKSLNMWEGWWTGSDVYYTDNAGALVLAILGLYPIQAPGAQWVITSPSVTTAVIHGIKDTVIQANHNSTRNTYISSIQVNGATYPSYFISGKRLVTENSTITLDMTSTPSRIGNMYVTGTDGEVLAAGTQNTTFLQFQNDPLALTSRAKIYATKRPTAVSVNGLPLTNWTYDSSTSTLNIKGIPAGNVLISFGGTVTPAPNNTPVPTATPAPSSGSPSTIPVSISPSITPGSPTGCATRCHESSRILRTDVFVAESASQAGLQRAASPLPGLQGCPLLLFPLRAACGGAKRKKSFSGLPRTPAGRLRSLRLAFRTFVSKIRDDSRPSTGSEQHSRYHSYQEPDYTDLLEQDYNDNNLRSDCSLIACPFRKRAYRNM